MEDPMTVSHSVTNIMSNHVETGQTSVHVQKSEPNVEHVDNDIRVDKTNDKEADSKGETEHETTKLEELTKPAPTIKTLADLIQVCRNRGLQIYNDKQNIPEEDKLKALPAYLTDTKVHRSDGLDVRRRASVTSGRRSRRHSSYRQADSVESYDRIKSSNSQRTSRSFKSGSELRLKSSCSSTSRVHSEYSSITEQSYGSKTFHEKLDFPDFEGDLEAEKVLQMRMRRRSKRHKDVTTSLSDVIKMKQRELEMMQEKLNSTSDEHPEHPNDEDPGEITINTKGEPGKTETDVDNTTNVNVLRKDDVICESGGNDDSRLIDNRGDSSKVIENNHKQNVVDNVEKDGSVIHEADSSCPSRENQPETIADESKLVTGVDTEIQEYVIQDGNTKLVLYRLKTNTSVLENLDKNEKHKNGINKSKTSEGTPDANENIEECHINTNGEQPETELQTNISDNAEQNTQGDSKTVTYINNSQPVDGNIINDVITSEPQTTQCSQSLAASLCNGHIRNMNENENKTDESNENNGEFSGTHTSNSHKNKLQGTGLEQSINTDVNKTCIDLGGELNDNKTNSNSNNDTGRDVVFNDNDRSRLKTVDKPESSIQEHVSTNTGDMESNCEVDTTGNNNSVHKQSSNDTDSVSKDNSSEKSDGIKSMQENGQSNGDIKTPVQKRPKRSLGNGFLVSADDGEDLDDIKDINQNNTPETNTNVKGEHDEQTKANVREKGMKTFETGSVKGSDIQQPTTSGRQSKTTPKSKKFSSAAKQVLIAASIKQTFNEERSHHSSYVQELGDARKALWDILRKMKAGDDDLKENKGMDTTDLEASVKEDEAQEIVVDDGKQEETLEEDADGVAQDPGEEPDKNSENTEPDTIDERQEGVGESESIDKEEERHDRILPNDKGVTDDHAENNDDNASQTTSNAKPGCRKKIDNEWDPNHPIYEQLKNGFKSNFKRHDTKNVHVALKDLRVGKFDTTQVSDNNVYLVEARRIYPKGFPESENKAKKINSQSKENIKFEKETVKSRDPLTRYDPNRLVRETTAYGGNDTQRSVEQKISVDYKPRNVKRVKKSDNNSTLVKQEASTPRKIIVPRFKPKQGQNKVDTEDERLTREKSTIEQFQEYINKSAEIPAVKNHRKNNQAIPKTNRRRPKKNPIIVHRAKFTTQKGTNELSDDEDVPLDEYGPEPMVARENVNDRLVRLASARSFGSDRRTDDVPLNKAVEIIQSRQKFYNNERGEIQTNQREHRVFKLFQEIQMIRQKGDHSFDTSTLVDYPVDGMNASGFLTMDYDFSQSTISSHKTDNDLQKFLFNSLDYEVSVRSRSFHSFSRKRDKALSELRQKLDHPLVFSSNFK